MRHHFARRLALLAALPVLAAMTLAPSAQAKVADDDWYRGVRIRVDTHESVIDFTAEIRMDAGTPSSNVHIVASDDQGTYFNSPSIPLSGMPNDRARLNKNLVSGAIDVTEPIYDLRDGKIHEIDIEIWTVASAAEHPWVPASQSPYPTGHRITDSVHGRVLLDGEVWIDFDDLASYDVMVWHFSTIPPQQAPGLHR